MGVVLAGQAVLYAVTLHLRVPFEHMRVLILCLHAAGCALMTAAVERRLWPAAGGYLANVAIATIWPTLAWPVESFANLLLTVNVWVIWRSAEPERPTDTVGARPLPG